MDPSPEEEVPSETVDPGPEAEKAEPGQEEAAENMGSGEDNDGTSFTEHPKSMMSVASGMERDDEYEEERSKSVVSITSSRKSKKGKKGKKKKKKALEIDVAFNVVIESEDCIEYEEDDKDVSKYPEGFYDKLKRLAALNSEIKLVGPGREKSPAKSKKKKKKKDAGEMSEIGQEEEPTRRGTELANEKSLLLQTLQDEVTNEEINTQKRIREDEAHMRIRRRQLVKTICKVQERQKCFMDHRLKNYHEQEWTRYLDCNGLPDPAVIQDMNTYLYLWSFEDNLASMETLPRQCEIAIYLIKKMDEIIDFAIHATPNYLKECKEVRQKFREKLQHWIDLSSYCLLRQIDRDTIRVDLKNATYIQQLDPLVCCFWSLIRLPISIKPLLDKDKKPFEVEFQEVGISVRMPLDLDVYNTAMRVIWYGYDHYSDLAMSFFIPQLPKLLMMDMDLWTFNLQEFEKLTQIREDQAEDRERRLEEKRLMIKRILQPPKEDREKKKKKVKKTESSSGVSEAPPIASLASPEEIIIENEEEMRKEKRRLLFSRCKKTEINLRKYAVLGGLYRIDLIRQPPQPKDMRREILLTTLQLPKELDFVEFSRPYKAPPAAPDAERTPEVIEAEIRALETAMDKLALVTIKLPDSVMWFEPPLVAHWLSDEKIWSTEDVHDIKYNEEKQTMTFRTGRLGIHCLAGYKFVNLPFQSWEMKPESNRQIPNRGVVLSITAAIIQLEFLVREDQVSLHSIAGGISTALQDLVGKFMELDQLMTKMKLAGCDVFPEQDAASYLKGAALKHPCATKHLQSCMGLLCMAYVFSWSRWNATRPHREIVIQIKEIHGNVAKERSSELVMVTPFRTKVVVCSEVSAEFSDTNATPGDKFYSDLYYYALHNAGVKSRLAMKNISFKLSETVSRLLDATNILNMSA